MNLNSGKKPEKWFVEGVYEPKNRLKRGEMVHRSVYEPKNRLKRKKEVHRGLCMGMG